MEEKSKKKMGINNYILVKTVALLPKQISSICLKFTFINSSLKEMFNFPLLQKDSVSWLNSFIASINSININTHQVAKM